MSELFEKAAADSKNLAKKPDNDELLQLYSLYKVGNSEDFEKVKEPGSFDFTGKYKYKAWKKEVDAGTTKEDAQDRYVKLVEALKEKYGFKA